MPPNFRTESGIFVGWLEEWLGLNYPDRAAKVLNLIRQCRGGKLNDPGFGSRMAGTGQYAELIRRRFEVAVRKYGLNAPRREVDLSAFRGGDPQLKLF